MFKQTIIKDARDRRIDFQVNFELSEARKKLSRDELLSLSQIFHDDIQGIVDVKWTADLGSREILQLLGNAIPFAVAFLAIHFLPQPSSTWLRNVFWLVIIASCMVLWFTLVSKWSCRSLSHERPFPKAVLGFGHCPACLYDLQQLEPEAIDGCTVCPECGGAWKLP